MGYSSFVQGGGKMSNKLVYISGTPFWITPEGRFKAVEMKNGLPVERIIMKK